MSISSRRWRRLFSCFLPSSVVLLLSADQGALLGPPGQADRLTLAAQRLLGRIEVLPDRHQLPSLIQLHDISREHSDVDHFSDDTALRVRSRFGRLTVSQDPDLLRTDRDPPAASLDHVR